ncbi:hypothetical protein BJV77DRAFT_1063569 [Russula vinacea]|nr:hypothetical protein BJV77DRAFT_1063569 [Russula vinacea]
MNNSCGYRWLALACASVERALTLPELVEQDNNVPRTLNLSTGNEPTQQTGFSDAAWGDVTRNHAKSQFASSKESENTSTPPFKQSVLLDIPHHRYFFDDGNITFRVQGRLYRLHRYLFCKSNEFKDRLSQLSTQQESPTIL